MPTLLAQARDYCAVPLAELKTCVDEAVFAANRNARLLIRRGAQTAGAFQYETERAIRRRPLETVALAFAAGAVAGVVAGWLLRRR